MRTFTRNRRNWSNINRGISIIYKIKKGNTTGKTRIITILLTWRSFNFARGSSSHTPVLFINLKWSNVHFMRFSCSTPILATFTPFQLTYFSPCLCLQTESYICISFRMCDFLIKIAPCVWIKTMCLKKNQVHLTSMVHLVIQLTSKYCKSSKFLYIYSNSK